MAARRAENPGTFEQEERGPQVVKRDAAGRFVSRAALGRELDQRREHDAAADAADQVAVIEKILRRVERKLSSGSVKPSLADYIRLVQLHKELDEEAPKEIRVMWVEPGTKVRG